MGKAKASKQYWILYDGKWYNFHQYQKFDRFGGTIFVVRGPCKRKGDFTRSVTTKFVQERNGDYRFISEKKEKLWKDEKKQIPQWESCWRKFMNVWRNQA